jgi:hypothetical protein
MGHASTIDRFRKRFHGNSTLRLLTLRADGQGLYLAREINRGFYIGRDFDTQQGAYTSLLTIDTNLNGATRLELDGITYVDLVAPDEQFQRYRLRSDTPPQFTDDRWVIGLAADFDNKLAIDGVIVYDPDNPVPNILPNFNRYIHTQIVPATEWIINHNIGEWPEIELFDASGKEIDGAITNTTLNQSRATFTLPITGSARCI